MNNDRAMSAQSGRYPSAMESEPSAPNSPQQSSANESTGQPHCMALMPLGNVPAGYVDITDRMQKLGFETRMAVKDGDNFEAVSAALDTFDSLPADIYNLVVPLTTEQEAALAKLVLMRAISADDYALIMLESEARHVAPIQVAPPENTASLEAESQGSEHSRPRDFRQPEERDLEMGRREQEPEPAPRRTMLTQIVDATPTVVSGALTSLAVYSAVPTISALIDAQKSIGAKDEALQGRAIQAGVLAGACGYLFTAASWKLYQKIKGIQTPGNGANNG